jgi:RNA polymerase sigma-54 factor
VAVDDHRHTALQEAGQKLARFLLGGSDSVAPGGIALSFALEMSMAPKVALEVSPALVAFGELLILPCAAMQSVVERELSANPALERLDPGECPICRGGSRARCPACSVPARRRPGSRVVEAGDRAASEADAELLLRAVRMEIGAADAPIAECLIDSLDEHGRLDRSCAEIAADLGVAEAAVASVLDVVRRCGPPGVGATSIAECLLLQLDALELDEDVRLARVVIADHLPALARGRFSSIAKAIGASREEVVQVLHLIRRRLRPHPAFDGATSPASHYVVPDAVIRAQDGDFTVELVEPASTRLAVRPGGDASRARSFLALLQDRWSTLQRVVEYTVERQRDFLVDGEPALKPLTRAEVAAALDLHESTVSRAIADKYALLPDGTILALSRFFGVSGAVDAELRRLLESADGPMSDQRLADRLREAGFPIARRTVAKHRARLGFTAAPLR